MVDESGLQQQLYMVETGSFPGSLRMNRTLALIVLLAGTATLVRWPLWSAESPARNAAAANLPRARFTETVSYHSAGRLTYATGTKERDRTITLVPIDREGPVATLDTTIVDHVDDDFEYRGVLNVDAQGTVTTRQKEMINAANILMVSPQAVKQLLDGRPEALTSGYVEVSGDLIEVQCTHRLIGAPGDVPLRVRTSTRTPDAKIDLETTAAFGADGLPLSAQTRGTIKAIVTVSVDLSLTRIITEKKDARAGVATAPAREATPPATGGR